jgi:tricorn protease
MADKTSDMGDLEGETTPLAWARPLAAEAGPKRERIIFRQALGALLSAVLCGLATAAGAAQDSLWLREPAISPDGSRIAFRFEGQIWIAPTVGGDALALTPAGFHSASPVWSPSGDAIAFAADRFGPMNIFVAPVAGGEARRLTWYALDEKPSSFTPDGKAVLFSSRRLGDATQTFAIPSRFEQGNQLYEVPVAGGRDQLVLPNAAFNARWDAEKRRLLYTDASIEQPFRQRQTSSAARQVWLYDAASGRHERLTGDAYESRDAVWSTSGDIYYLSEASGSLNVWRLSLADRRPVQITHFAGDPVRWLSISQTDELAFSRDGDLYRLPRGASEPERIAVNIVRTGFEGEHANRTTHIDDFALSPNGKDIALVTRGDVFVASMNGKYVKRITRTPGEERTPTFSSDGRRLAYAGERDGRWSLYETRIVDPDEKTFSEATEIEERLLKAGDQDAMQPAYAPDGAHIAYVANRDSVRVLDVGSKIDVEILPKGQDFALTDWPWGLAWSPDSKWVAVPMQPSGDIQNIGVAPADGSRPATRIAPSGEDQERPAWSAGGLLLWSNYADALHLAYEGNWLGEIEAVFSSRKAHDIFRAKLREPVVTDAAASDARERRTSPDEAEPARTDDAESKAPKAKERQVFSFEPDGVEDRKITLSQEPTHLVYYGLLADGVSVLSVDWSLNAEGNGFTATGTVRDLREGRRKTLFSGLPYQVLGSAPDQTPSPVLMSKDRKKLYFLSRAGEAATDGVMEVDVAKGSNRLIKIMLDTTRDEAEARKAAFEQFWTLTKKRFFDRDFNGVDWDAARRKYERFLPSIVDGRDLAELLSEMSGELNASHTGGYFRALVPSGEQTASLGLYYDERYPGPGMKVAEIVAGGPFDAGDSALKPGDVLRQIDGEDIPEDGGVRRMLRGRANQLVAIAAEHPDGTRFTEKHVLISIGREYDLARARWIKRKREAVVAKSCGRLGYVYVPGMDSSSYRSTFSEVFGRFPQADGLIVDIRYNTGGNLHNHLLTLLSGKAYMDFEPSRGGPNQQEPRDRWTKPSAVVMNAESYSDASVFPHAYHDLKLGALIGDPVAGTGTATWWPESLIIPGLVYGLAQLPIRDRDGTLFENAEVVPDIPVPSNPTAWEKGEDPQLDAAIKALLPDGAGACRSP